MCILTDSTLETGAIHVHLTHEELYTWSKCGINRSCQKRLLSNHSSTRHPTLPLQLQNIRHHNGISRRTQDVIQEIFLTIYFINTTSINWTATVKLCSEWKRKQHGICITPFLQSLPASFETSKHNLDSYWLTIWGECVNVSGTDQSPFNPRLVKSTFWYQRAAYAILPCVGELRIYQTQRTRRLSETHLIYNLLIQFKIYSSRMNGGKWLYRVCLKDSTYQLLHFLLYTRPRV